MAGILTEEQVQQTDAADHAADYAAHDPDDAEPDPAADPAAARSCCHYAVGTKGDPSPEVLVEARQVRRW